MMLKRIMVLLVLMTVFGLVPVFAMGGKPPKEPIQEYKTHVSKYGFSVSYPADWYLEEIWRFRKIPENKKGWLGFYLYRVNPDIAASFPNKDELFEMQFGVSEVENLLSNIKDGLENAPKNADEKMKYIMFNFEMRSIDDYSKIKKWGISVYLAYGVPRGMSRKLYVLTFYLPGEARRVRLKMHKAEKYSVEELLDKIEVKLLN